MQKYIITMAIEQSTNLEKTSEKNVLNVEVFEAEKYSKITHSFKIPFKELKNPFIDYLSFFNVIDIFSDVVVKALEERMESCMDMLSRNLFNIVESNKYHVLFKKENGSYHSFNHDSFKCMQEAINLIYEARYEDLRKKHYGQIIKALYWIEKPAQRDGISFGNLISVCMERFKISLM